MITHSNLVLITSALVLAKRHIRQLGKGRGQALELEWGVPSLVLTADGGPLAGAGGRHATLGVLMTPIKQGQADGR